MPHSQRIPKYRKHRASGQAVVTLCGHDFYLGPHGTEASRIEYDRLVTEWLANGRSRAPGEPLDGDLTINEILKPFLEHADTYYRRPDGTPTSEISNFEAALRPLVRLYGDTVANDFGPLSLKSVRQAMLDLEWSRSHINKQVNRIRMVFKWAVANELVGASVYESLRTVDGLKRGRTTARETKRVRPVPQAAIDAVEPFVSRQVWAMIQLQRFTGARAGEIIVMRPIDLDMSELPWVFRPASHKTAHHGHERTIYLGPRAQALVQPFLNERPLDACLFSPRESECDRRRKQHEERTTPLSCGNRPGTNRKARPKRAPGDQFDVASYRRAIQRACDLAFPAPDHLARQRVAGAKGQRWERRDELKTRLGPERWEALLEWQREHRWHPHQLRHAAATELRREFGLDAARVILGHRSAAITEVYAELDAEKAKEVIRQVG